MFLDAGEDEERAAVINDDSDQGCFEALVEAEKSLFFVDLLEGGEVIFVGEVFYFHGESYSDELNGSCYC